MMPAETLAARKVFAKRTEAVLDIIFALANRENDDPLVMDARDVVQEIERVL